MEEYLWALVGGVIVAIIGLIGTIIGTTKSSISKIRDLKDEIIKHQREAAEKLSEGNTGISGTHKSLSDEHKEIKNVNEKLFDIGKNTYGKIENIDKFLAVEQARHETLSKSEYQGFQKSVDFFSAILKDWEKKTYEFRDIKEKYLLLQKENSALIDEAEKLREEVNSLKSYILELEEENENEREFER